MIIAFSKRFLLFLIITCAYLLIAVYSENALKNANPNRELMNERCEIKCVKPYIEYCNCSVGRISRNSEETINITFLVNRPMYNNASCGFSILEGRGNSYEKGVVEFQTPSCNISHSKLWFFMPSLSKCSNFAQHCPMNLAGNMELKYERCETTCQRPYVEFCNCSMGKVSRNSAPVINVTLLVTTLMYNNASCGFSVLERRGNTYQKGVIEYETPYCDIKQSKFWFFYPNLTKHSNFGRNCPTIGTVYVKNFSYDLKNFPSYIPFRNVVLNLYCFVTKTHQIFYDLKLFLTIIERKKKQRSKSSRSSTIQT